MTQYPSNEEVEKDIQKSLFEYFSNAGIQREEDIVFSCQDAQTLTSNVIPIIRQSRLSDLDAIIEKVEGIYDQDDGCNTQWNAALDSVLSYLKSLKENKV